MAKAKHYHEWQYGEPEHCIQGSAYEHQFDYWKIYRFCTLCLEGEEIKLNPLSN